jgi:hypothetical protein
MAQIDCWMSASRPDSASRLIGSGSAGWNESRGLPACGPVSSVNP